ncbi:MAG: TIGR03936 family radical SAM-associated protein [Candidatus Zixiibacteriota bacterium]
MGNSLAHKNLSEFSELIERRFLPHVTKPARYVAGEWRAGALGGGSKLDAGLPLVAIASANSYESSVNDPFLVAVAEALADSGLCRVGWFYPFGAEARARLEELGAAPFVAPQLAPLSLVELVIAPLRRSSDLFGALHQLSAAGVCPSRLKLDEQYAGEPVKMIAINERPDWPESFTGVFDRVLSLTGFVRAIREANDLNDLLSAENHFRAAETAPTCSFIPEKPPGPVIDVSLDRARFRFVAGGREGVGEENSESLARRISEGTLDSGQTGLQLENCLDSALPLTALLNGVSHRLEAGRFSIHLSDVAAYQLSPLLAGALKRYRRARVEVGLCSLSQSALGSIDEELNFGSLTRDLQTMQRIENLQLQLTVRLGYPAFTEVEAEETIVAIKSLSSALNPRRGLRIRFVHFTPLPGDTRRDVAVKTPAEVGSLFAAINSRKARGISLTLVDSFAPIADTLLARGAWSDPSELLRVATEIHSSSGESDDARSEVLKRHASILAAQEADRMSLARREFRAPSVERTSASAENPTPLSNAASVRNGEDFGRARKRGSVTPISSPARTRLRFTWARSVAARFHSHLDDLRAIEGALRRARLPVSYTQGMRPRPKISFGPPLPVGFTSECELFDASFDMAPSPDELERFALSLPPGFSITGNQTIYTKALSILDEVSAASYLVALPGEDVSVKLEAALAGVDLFQVRRTKSGERRINLLPGVYAAEPIERLERLSAPLSPGDGETVVKLTLALSDTIYVRPEEFLLAAELVSPQRALELRIHRLAFHTGQLRATRQPQISSSGRG